MPGPVSDSYDPEWGTAAKASAIRACLQDVYRKASSILGERPPLYILDLVSQSLPVQHTATLTEKDWRLIRFALERAIESL